MRVMVSIEHPSWVYHFRFVIERLKARGDDVRVLAVDKDGDLELLERYHIPYVKMANTTGTNILEKGFLFVWLSLRYTVQCLRYRPDILIGCASPMMAIAAWLCRKPHLVYEDTEVSKFSLRICKHLSTELVTGTSFLSDLGPKQRRVDTYKEFFYLHPSVFTSDKQLLLNVGFNVDEPYILVRFVAWNASHDVGKKGLPEKDKLAFVQKLEKYGRVYVSSESPLSPELEPYRLPTPYELIHHVLYYARLYVGEGATMASESAMLGTYAVYINPIVLGYINELNEKYHLLYQFNEGKDRYERALDKACELLETPGLAESGKQKREQLTADKMDINAYFVERIDALAKRAAE